MSNLREINDDILKDWLDFREDAIASLSSTEDKKHFIYFDEILKKILKNAPVQNKNMSKNNWICLIRILLIIFAIGMRSIIGMGFVME